MLLSKDVVHIYIPGVQNVPPSDTHHIIGAFVINEEVVHTGIYSKEFYDLYKNSVISEESENPDTGFITVKFLDGRDNLSMFILLDNKLASIMLSNPDFIEVPDGHEWVFAGTRYVNGEFIDDRQN